MERSGIDQVSKAELTDSQSEGGSEITQAEKEQLAPLEKQLVSSKTRFVPANYKEQFSLLRKIDDVTGTKHEIK